MTELGHRGVRRLVALTGVIVVALATVVAGALPAAAADPTASMSIQKAASDSTVTPGQNFTYTIQFQCTAGTVNGCVNAKVDDPMPAYITIVGTPKVTGTSNYDAGATTSTELVMTFTDNLGGGDVGLAPGHVVTVEVPVHVDDDAPPTADGTTIHNTATITADNANTKQASADVTLNVPSTLDASTTKSISPAGGPNDISATTTAAVTGKNTSNVPVKQLIINDPVLGPDGIPPTANNPLSVLEIQGLDPATPITYPANAETAQVRAYDSSTGEWLDGPVVTKPANPTLPASVDPTDVTGVQLIFTSTDDPEIQPGESGGVNVVLHLKEELPEDQLPYTITNVANTTVIDDAGNSATSDPASATYRVPPNNVNVSAGKRFDPEVVHAGDPSTVTLTGTNESSDPIDSLTITEPSPGTPNHFADGEWTYTPSTAPVVFPAGATTGSVTYVCAGTPSSTSQALSNNSPLPAPPADCDPVTGLSTTFTGSIASGATATVPFQITTAKTQNLESMFWLNVVRVDGQREGTTGSDTALAVIQTIKDRIKVDVGKTLRPSTIPSYPGQIVTASLSGRLLPFPDSTVDATTIVVQDPNVIPDPNEWYGSFNPEAVTATAVPGCSSLTVQYTVDGTAWLDVPGMTDIQGATIVNESFPDEIREDAIGVRFVYTAAPAGGGCSGGFPPGTSVNPNLSYALDADAPDEQLGTVTDCAASSASSATTPDTHAGPACDAIDITPVNPGSIDPVDKSWSPSTVLQRSQADTTVTLSWSTAGFTGTGRIDITDTQNPDTTAIADSAFDAFDLTKINPITSADDPWLTYDQISKVQLYLLPSATSTDPSSGRWVDATNDPCPNACDGVFPGYTLTAAETERAIGFRLTYIESPTRADRLGNPGAPPVGSGVAESTGNDRHIKANFKLRDVRRSDPNTPVTADQVYNAADEGIVHNTVRLDPYWNVDDTDPILTRTDGADIEILAVPLTADGTKSWAGGPLGIPEAGVPQSEYPTSRISLTASNTTPSKIDRLSITEPDTSNEGPSSCTTNPFDTFNLVGFTAITPPSDIGASDVTIHLTPGPGGTTDYTRDQALALTETQLAGVTGMTVTYGGRINAATTSASPTATVTFDVRLRTENRTSNAAPDPGTVCNQTKVEAADMVDFPDFTESQNAFRDADIDLVPQGIDVVAGKSFDPTSITEPSHGPVKVTLSGQPTAPTPPGGATPPSRAVKLVLEDTASGSAATFFNAYDFDSFATLSYSSPIDQVQVDAYVGGAWSISGGKPVLTGGHWEIGSPSQATTLLLPSGVTKTQVQGLRFTFTRADGANWENPADPKQSVSFNVLRRDTLHTGGPVPSDLAGTDPAPGETVAGDSTDGVTATVTSSDVDADGNPLTASDDAHAAVHYQHATNEVQIRKTPNGETESPGTPFTYTIPVKDTGDIDIANPVITEVFPADAAGPQIQLAADPNYLFGYDGDTGDIPTAAANVTVVPTTGADGKITGLVFTFPSGSIIAIGKTYTVKFTVVTRPGLEAGTQFTNTVGVTGDRPWDSCNNGGSNTVEPGGSCQTDATNTVTSAGAITVTKKVKAEGSDVLGVEKDPLDATKATCTADGDGFYGRPCIPIAEPGGDITWRWQFQNTGNLPLDRILGIDQLPARGDTLATAPLQRLSLWQPVLTGVRPSLVNAQAGTLDVYYTTASTWCDDPEAIGDGLLCDGTNGQGDLSWQLWDADTSLADLGVDPATVTGLQIAFEPDSDLAPAATFDVDVTMKAPAYSPVDIPNTTEMSPTSSYAFNTVGTTARVAGGENQLRNPAGGAFAPEAAPVAPLIGGTEPGEYTLTTEPPRVGVGLAHGGFTLQKSVGGAAADKFAPGSYPVTISCTSAGENVPLPGDVASQTLTPDIPVSVYDLPYHATCTVTEADRGQTSSNSPVRVTVQQDVADFETAGLTNTYDFASLSITKNLDSAAVDQEGNAVEYGPFTIHVACTFLGDPVFAAGYGPLRPMTVDLTAGEVDTFTELPAGASCTITETDDKGATATTIETTVDGDTSTANGNVATIELAPDGEGGDTENSAVITNTFGDGSLALLKKVTGDAADAYGAGPFILHVTCVLDDETGTRTVWDGDVSLGGGAPLSSEIVHIAAGAECAVTETDDGHASSVTIDPADPVSVNDGEAVTVTATNEFDPAKLIVDKEVDGDAAGFAPDSFPIEVTCVSDGDVLPGFPKTVVVTPGTPAVVDTLVGAECTAVETDTGQATEVTYDPPAVGDGDGSAQVPITEDTDDPATITVTNTYRAGALQILKDLTGPGASLATGPFTFGVSCSFNGDNEAFTDSVTVKRSGNGNTLVSDPISPLPVGAVCTVTETDSGGADSTPPPVTVTIPDVNASGAAQVVVATMVNPFSAGRLQVRKVLAGDGASAHAATVFAVKITCQLDVSGTLRTVYSGTVTLRGGQTVTVSGPSGDPVLLPNDSHCFGRETDSGGADASTVDFDSYANAAVVAAGDSVQTLTITITNTFSAPTTTPTTTTAPPTTLPNTGAPITLQLWWTVVLIGAGMVLLILGAARRQRGLHR